MLLGRASIELRMWAVEAGEVPEDHDEQIDWLFGEWCTLDRWLSERESAASRDNRHRPATAR